MFKFWGFKPLRRVEMVGKNPVTNWRQALFRPFNGIWERARHDMTIGLLHITDFSGRNGEVGDFLVSCYREVRRRLPCFLSWGCHSLSQMSQGSRCNGIWGFIPVFFSGTYAVSV